MSAIQMHSEEFEVNGYLIQSERITVAAGVRLFSTVTRVSQEDAKKHLTKHLGPRMRGATYSAGDVGIMTRRWLAGQDR